jgi:uncharacterized iron-regulated membrane protein
MTFKKAIGKIHLWLGLISGIIVIVLGITGSIIAFEDEIKSVVYKARLYVDSVQSASLPLSQLHENARKSLPADIPFERLWVHNDPQRTVRFGAWHTNDNTDGIWYWNGKYNYYHVYLDPYTGQMKKLEDYNLDFFTVVLQLHMRLLLKHDIGKTIVGVSVLIFVISLITGLVLWWPKKRKKAVKQRLWFQWKSTTNWKRKNYDLHNIMGFYAMLLALIIALTGLVWSFDWFDDGVKWIANGGKTIEEKKEKVVSDTTHVNAQYPIDKVFQNVKQKYPNAEEYSIRLPQKVSDTYSVIIVMNKKSDYVWAEYDQFTGKELSITTFADKNNGEKLRAMNYDIHVGKILGLPGKILAFFASLVSASLPVTGFIIWWGRRNKKRSKNNKKRSTSQRNAARPKLESKQHNGAVKSHLTEPKARNTEGE